jgi:hypothetical protein
MHMRDGSARIRILAVAASLIAASLALAQTASSGTRREESVTNRTWHCTGPQHGTVVNAVEHAVGHIDAIHLDSGCTGALEIHVLTWSADGVKVHDGAHDLVVTGDVECRARLRTVHQDGVQAMGGQNVQFGDGHTDGSFRVDCPTGNNGGLWVNEGDAGHSLPTGIVCDHCDLYERNVAVHIGRSVASGVRSSLLHLGTGGASPRHACVRIEATAQAPVDVGNRCVR